MRRFDRDKVSVAIIILTLNQKEKTLRCIESCRSICDVNYRIILWDNASSDGTFAIVKKQYPEVICFHSKKNIGVAGGRNESAREAIKFAPDYLLFLDNDTIVEPDFLLHLIEALSGSDH